MSVVQIRAVVLSLAIVLLLNESALGQACINCAGGGYFRQVVLFGNRGPCLGYNVQAEVDVIAATNSSARWSYGNCANAPRSAGLVGIASTATFLTGLSGPNDFLMVANDTCRHLRIANNSSLENSGNICLDLTPTAGTQVNRMTLWPDGKIDFNIGNWNCQKGMIRFEAESWDGSWPNVDDPVMKLYRPTGTDGSCPNPTSYTWWIQNSGSSGGDNGGSLQFRALPTSGAIGSETVSTMQTRLIIQRNGNVGINTLTPIAKLEVVDGAVLFDGTTGSTPTSGAGTRLMWVPAEKTLCVGGVSGSQWDILASYSILGGYNCANRTSITAGNYSITAGYNVLNTGYGSAGFGFGTSVEGDHSLGFGLNCKIWFPGGLAGGEGCEVYGYNAVALGATSVARGLNSVAIGTHCETKTNESIAVGDNCVAGTTVSSGAENHASVALGHDVASTGSDVIGLGRHIIADGYWSTAVGSYLNNSGKYSILVGQGLPSGSITNSDMNVFKIGLNSDIPTMTILGGAGTGTLGNVGIGIENPTYRFESAGGMVIGETYVNNSTIIANPYTSDVYIEGQVSMGTVSSPTLYQLVVKGDMFLDGYFYNPSDSTLKTEIKACATGLDAIKAMDVVSFRFKEVPVGAADRIHMGVIAQELQNILPIAVRTDSFPTYRIVTPGWQEVDTVWYPNDKKHPFLKVTKHPPVIDSSFTTRMAVCSEQILYTAVNAIKELAKDQDTLKAQVNSSSHLIDSIEVELKQTRIELAELKALVSGLIATIQESSLNTGINSKVKLEQNRPNPFSVYTDITFEIDNSLDGQFFLEVTNLQTSMVMTSQEVTAGSQQTVRIDATGWSKGPYIYCIRSTSGVLACKKMSIVIE